MNRIVSFLLASLMLLSLIPAVSAADELPFKDVTAKKWFYTDVKYVYDNGLMNGMTETTFEPTKSMSRSMFVTVLGRLCGAEEHDNGKFPDVKRGSWYAGYVGWAAENGIVGGYNDGTFKPDKTITREEAAAVIVRFIDYISMLPTWDVTAPSSFADVKKIGSWARESVDSLRTSGIIAGNNGNFDPKKTLSRAEAATILARLHRMKESLRLDDPIDKSYLTEDGKLHFLGAWDMYYSGTALNSGYNGTKVDDTCKTPLLVGDEDGRTYRYMEYTMFPGIGNRASLLRQKAGCAEGYWYSFDTNILNVKLSDHPIVKFCTNAAEARIGIDLYDGTSAKLDTVCKDGTVTADLSAYAAKADASDEPIVSIMSDTDFGIYYVGFFKSTADAEAFTSDGIDLSKPTEARVDITEANENTIDDYNAQVDARIKEINSLPDLDPADYGTCYYVSSIRGDDKNDGLSPDRPVKTEDALFTLIAGGTARLTKAKPGDAVFIERGSVFRDWEAMPGVAYSPYGEGEKPIFTHALDINGSMDWSKTEFENIWKLDGDIPDDVGNIVFRKDDVEGWGTKVLTNEPFKAFVEECMTVDNGIVSTGFEVYDCPSRLCRDESVLCHNLEFIFDYQTNSLYLYFDKGDPGEYFDTIIAATSGTPFYVWPNSSGITTRVHNLSVRHSGSHGISIDNAKDVAITGCDVLWTGGCLWSGNTRFGNAIQNWGLCNRFVVSDCYISQVYDTGITTQMSGSPAVMQNAYFKDNVIECCDMSFEFYTGYDGTSKSGLYNVFVTGNMIRNAGHGIAHNVEGRPRGCFILGDWGVHPYDIENFAFENNLCLCATSVSLWEYMIALGDHTKGNIYRNNTYVVDGTHGYQLIGMKNLSDLLHSNFAYPVTEQYLQYFRDMGVDVGSHFIVYDGYLTEEEELGACRIAEK